jgi:unsaturated rhamnogalacturonyl hydrolase
LVGTKTAPSVFNKTAEGGYWHKNEMNYQDVMTVDGIYMAYPFLVKYGKMFNDTTAINVAVAQTLLVASHSFNTTTHLPYHAWDYSRSKPWANPITGTSPLPWSRSVGWFAMALVDILENLPPAHKDYGALQYLLQQLALGIRESQNAGNGLWYQVVNGTTSADNYPETSGSGMIVYAIRKAVDHKWIDTAFNSVAENGWKGLKTMMTVLADGSPQITSVAPAMGCKKSYEEYVAVRPVSCPSNDAVQHPHGYCAVLMAASVMEYPADPYRK